MRNMIVAILLAGSLPMGEVRGQQKKVAQSSSKFRAIQIKGMYSVPPSSGEKIYLTITPDKSSRQYKLLDSLVVAGSNFVWFPKNLQPNKYVLRNKAGQAIPVYLDYGITTLRIEPAFMKSKVKGSQLDSLLKKYDGVNTMASFSQMAYGLTAMKYKQENKEIPDSLTQSFIVSQGKIDSSKKALTRELGSRRDLVGAYVLTNGGAAVFSNREMNESYSAMPAWVKETPIGRDFKIFLDKQNSLAIGVKAPDFVQKTPDGQDVRLSEFVKGKKLVLIDFWASWCAPCRKENPNVLAIYSEYRYKGFDIIGVSLDSKLADWKKAILDDKLTWTNVSDLGGWKNSLAALYNVSAVPHTLLIDSNGRIVAKNLRGEELRKQVELFCK